MKLNRESRRTAKRLFSTCRPDGRLDEGRVRDVLAWFVKNKPRHAAGILSLFERMVRTEVANRTAKIESAAPLADPAPVAQAVRARFGADLAVQTSVRPELLGGLRIQVGSDVWDGTVRGRLQQLAKQF